MKKLAIVICWSKFPLCICYKPQGESFPLITVLCLISSLNRIKRYRQEKAIGSRGEKNNQGRKWRKIAKMQQSNWEESWRTRSVSLRVEARGRKKPFWKVHWGRFLWWVELCWFWQQGIKGSHVSWGQTAPFQGPSACQHFKSSLFSLLGQTQR